MWRTIFIILTATMAGPPALADSKAWVATPFGVGPLKIGMSVPEAEAALGARLELDRDVTDDYEACTTAGVPGHTGVGLLFENLRLSRVSIGNASAIKTDRGLDNRATEADVKRAYAPLIEVTAAYSEPPALDLTFWAIRDKAGILFQTDTLRRVVEYRVGNKAIQYIEGCL
jgi:hypothetical protein